MQCTRGAASCVPCHSSPVWWCVVVCGGLVMCVGGSVVVWCGGVACDNVVYSINYIRFY